MAAWLLPAGILAAKGFKAVAGRLSGKKKGEATNKAEKAKAEAAQANRRARLGATSSMLAKLQGGLARGGYSPASGSGYTGGTGGGAPDYTLDPAALQALQEAPAYTPGPDAAAGQGWGMVGDMAGLAGEALEDYAVGQAMQPKKPTFEDLMAAAKRGQSRPAGF